MTSIILRTAVRLLLPLLLLFSIFLFLRGHYEPGGGFAGGLVAAAAFALYSIAKDSTEARRVLRIDPILLLTTGLLLALGSSSISLLGRQPFMTGEWVSIYLPGSGTIDIGTPLFFELGVFFVVTGVTLLIVFSLQEA